MLQTSGPVTQFARELDVDSGILSNWVNTWKLKNPELLETLTPTQILAVSEMETEIRRLRMKNNFLKKQRNSPHS